MNKKALSLAICLALALPTTSNALSLGDIESNSSLNQPFKGKIHLLSTSVAEAKTLRVRVAPASVFNRVGIDRPAFLNSIRFRTAIQNGRPVILVSSNQPINEPFLNFLLEVSWPNGQLLKEYTVLLDPPVLLRPDTAIASNAAGVRAEPRRAQGRITRPVVQQRRVVAQQPRRVVRAAPATPRRQATRNAAPNRRVVASQRQVTNYRVRRGDNLSKVATKLRYSGVQKDQMMIALYEKNRRAFSKNNINNLKAGALLKRPSLQEVRSIGSRKAKALVLAQAREWKKSRLQQVASKGKAVDKSSAVTTPKQARLEVVGSKEAITANSQTSSGNSSAIIAELNQQLSLVNESLTTRLKENEELKSRVSELESLLRKKNRLITLKSEQLAKLQETMSGAETTNLDPNAAPKITEVDPATIPNDNLTASVETPLPTVTDKEGIDIQQQLENERANQEGQIIRDAQQQPSVALAPTEPEVIAPTVETPKVESPFVSEKVDDSFDVMGLLSSPAALAGGLGSLALLGGLFYMRRRKSTDEDYEEFSSIEIDNDLDDPSFEESPFENSMPIDESNFVEHDEVQPTITESKEDLIEGNEQEDILQEADVYIVYGLHDQAESELKRAIEKDPSNLAFRAKLLENYKAAGDKEAFELEAKAFMQIDGEGKDTYLAEIAEWGNSLLPDNNLFSGGSVATAAAATGVAMVAGNALATEEEIEDLSSSLDEVSFDANDNSDELIDDINIDGLEGDFAIDEEGLENFDIDEVLAETDGDSFDEFEATLEHDETVKIDLNEEVDFDESELLGDIETNNVELDALLDDVSEESEEVVSDGSNIDLADIDLDFGSETEELESTMDLDSDFDFEDLNLDFNSESDDSLEVESNLNLVTESEDEITHLNLDLDSEDMKKIMPEDSAYTKTTSEEVDSNLSHEDNLLAEFDDNLSFLDLDNDSDVIEETQIETRLDLAKAYIDMGDIEGARSTLEEVMLDGNDEQKREAEELLHQTG